MIRYVALADQLGNPLLDPADVERALNATMERFKDHNPRLVQVIGSVGIVSPVNVPGIAVPQRPPMRAFGAMSVVIETDEPILPEHVAGTTSGANAAN